MELRQLEYFVAVAEERHFTRAARRALVSQSGLSASIRALERELGAPLFVRSTRHVELTEVGRAVLADARRALAGAAAARDAADAVRGLLRGTVVAGTEQGVTGVDVPAVLAAFRAEHPGVDVRLRHEGSLALLEQIPANRVDVAFVAITGPVPDGVRLFPVASSPMVLLCHPEHTVAVGEPTWADLAAQVFVDFPPDWSIRRLGDRAFARAGQQREVALEVNDVHGLIDLVRHDLGVAIVPESVARKKTAAGLAVRPLPGAVKIDWEVAVAVGAEERAGPAALELCRIARAETATPCR
ncbi:DNA-binding transcriptional LysR family regulator [Pseudonocardia hierapolitana]|uniref:DNA-binding transcriptional LysR family regulator n=1 Tax=Pseudonocardia hierapolitana TaxID=1128676 RepID=A0A561SP13_9PSEU|nr:LysR family transcriptional regulator [Pseudonocardia hierapolitana]TWF76601.1 DNA-binding transcriptional LysR family regulator [Pseudonocardia hierapolitana]